MDLGEVFKAHLGGDQQGQLVIKFAGEDHLCKISVENGQAIYLSLGTMGPTETLDAIVGKVAEWSNFIKGMPARKRLDQPVTELLINIAGAAPPAPSEIPVLATASSAQVDKVFDTSDIAVEGDVSSEKVEETMERFIDVVGPLGTILADKVCDNLSYSRGSQMPAAMYSRFVALLSTEVPEDDRQAFIDAAT